MSDLFLDCNKKEMFDNPYMSLRWDNHHGDLSSHFNYLLERELLVDVTLAAVGGSIRAHRLILSASSEYFQNILSEQPSDSNSIIILDDVKFKDLKALIKYIYKGKLNLSKEELPSLLEAAKGLKIKGLDHQVQEFEKSKPIDDLIQLHTATVSSDALQMDEPAAQVKTGIDERFVVYHTIPKVIIKEETEQMEEDVNERFLGEQLPHQEENRALLIREAEDAPVIALPFTSSASDCVNITQQARSIKRERIETIKAATSPEPMNASGSSDDLQGGKSAETTSTRWIFLSNLTRSGTSLTMGRTDGETGEKRKETALTEEITHSEEEQGAEDETEKSEHSSLENMDSFTDDSDNDVIPSTSTAAGPSEPKKNSIRKVLTKASRLAEENEGSLKCMKCGRSFKQKHHLKQHVEKDCGVEPQFSCAQCGRKFKRKTHLKGHLMRVHKVDHSQLATYGAATNVRPELPFKCVRCNRTYKTSKNLGRHLKYECEVNPAFCCTQCEYRATRKDSLRRHLAVVHKVDHSHKDNCKADALNGRPVLPFKC